MEDFRKKVLVFDKASYCLRVAATPINFYVPCIFSHLFKNFVYIINLMSRHLVLNKKYFLLL